MKTSYNLRENRKFKTLKLNMKVATSHVVAET